MQEILFTCELCKKQFPADPDTMLECSADFIGKDPVTGENIPLTAEQESELSEQMAENPEIAPFLKGAICVCLECQENWSNEAKGLGL